MGPLPIATVLPALLATLAVRPNAVLVAPPGAGKTVGVAPALLAEPWCRGRVLLLSPRRLAARAAAERMAELAGEPVGGRIGYATRLDSRQGRDTRLLVATYGVFLAMVQADPELAGTSAVLFDEVHERSLDGDFALALALDAQAGLRPDLRLLAMSATLDAARLAQLLGDAPVVETAGRAFPVDVRHLGRPAGRVEEGVAAACRQGLAETPGGVLAFLPGVAEIERTARLLDRLPDDVVLHRLHGTLDPAAQRRAIAPEAPGRRKLVLASAIAETSLTVDGITAVVDSGLARRARYDRAAGLTRLVTERVSQAAARQRAGRAGRQRAGVAYRLWEAAATAGLPPFDPPEIMEVELSGLLLGCGLWGVNDPAALPWLDPPPVAAVAEGRQRLAGFGLVDGDGRPTAHGRRVAALPLAPRLGHMLVAAAARGWGGTAAAAAVLLTEQGLGGTDADLETRFRRWQADTGPRARAAWALAGRWARLVGADPQVAVDLIGACVALAFPDRVARRRMRDGADWLSVGGRAFRLEQGGGDWLAVADTQGRAAGARILSAAPLLPEMVEDLFGDRIQLHQEVRFDAATGGVQAVRERRLGAVRLSGGPDASADAAAIAAALAAGVAAPGGLDRLPWPAHAIALRRRAAFVADPGLDLSDAALIARADEWLPPVLAGRRRLGDVSPEALAAALDGLLGWDGRQRLDRLAPAGFTGPLGSTHPIDWAAEGGPAVAVRVQALFGLTRHPTVGATPLVLHLLSPAGRPIQVTRDLPGFWAGSWAAVAKEMRGRYPRHPWPDDPATAPPTSRTKRAGA